MREAENSFEACMKQKKFPKRSEQKDLDLVLSKKLNWKENAQHRCLKACKAYNFLNKQV